MAIHAPVPILRMFDVVRTRDFYIGYLGFRIQFEHRFEPTLPLYMGIRRDRCELHLSEHHGDATPGSALRIEVDDIDGLNAELAAKGYGFARPRIEPRPWGTREMTITDPSGNRITFAAVETQK
ncbi:MAG TPA: glyoxalase superfamily protein [Hyphomicrobiaceae bacterium]|nr:glyoxalase superfamily protein [Hyphomicrobiaceae bacterium]